MAVETVDVRKRAEHDPAATLERTSHQAEETGIFLEHLQIGGVSKRDGSTSQDLWDLGASHNPNSSPGFSS